MRSFLYATNAFLKSFILVLRPGLFLNFLANPMLFIAHTIQLSKWISTNKVKGLNDFFSAKRDLNARYSLYANVIEQEQLTHTSIDYLEFGVYKGASFKYWVQNNHHPDSRFFGFDTFEGLPENWGGYAKGAFATPIPELNDSRHSFVKGLFQQSLLPFIESYGLKNGKRKIIHLDADLYSSTLYVLTILAPYLKAGDIILFDEFNVPNHEFAAFQHFCKAYYLKYEVLAAVNNYYQIGVKITAS